MRKVRKTGNPKCQEEMSFNYRSWSSYHKGHENNRSRDQVFHEKAKESAFQGTKLVAFSHIKSPKHKGNSKQVCPALGSSVEERCGTPGGESSEVSSEGSPPSPAAKAVSQPCPRATAAAQASLAPTAPRAAPQPGRPSPQAGTGPCRVLYLCQDTASDLENLHLYTPGFP